MTAPTLTATERDGIAVLEFAGALDATGAGAVWDKALAAAKAVGTAMLRLDLAGLTACDTAGVTLLLDIEAGHPGPVILQGATPALDALLHRVRSARARRRHLPRPTPLSWRETIILVLSSATSGIAFLGELAVTLVRLPRHLRMFRRQDFLGVLDSAGVRAVPLIVLLGILIGLILAFQSLVPMRRFGADLYVANLVAIGIIRELGPLLAAVILAGRSGSAFAAEIGTMKVNQEVDALVTMGLDPVTMLVLPRVLAGIAIMPALTVLLDLAGLLGMTLVLVGAGIPIEAIANQVAYWVVPRDFYGALVKSAVFGAAVAAIGCRAGLSTGLGPEAVGVSATAAVVGGIVGAITLDGAFAILFYRLGM